MWIYLSEGRNLEYTAVHANSKINIMFCSFCRPAASGESSAETSQDHQLSGYNITLSFINLPYIKHADIIIYTFFQWLKIQEITISPIRPANIEVLYAKFLNSI